MHQVCSIISLQYSSLLLRTRVAIGLSFQGQAPFGQLKLLTYCVLFCFDLQSCACECTSPLLGLQTCCTKGHEFSHPEQFHCVCWLSRIASPGHPKDSISNIFKHANNMFLCFRCGHGMSWAVCLNWSLQWSRSYKGCFLVLAEWHLDSSFVLLYCCSKRITLYY